MNALYSATSTSLPFDSDDWAHLRNPALSFGHTGLGQDADPSHSTGSLLWSDVAWPDLIYLSCQSSYERSDDEEIHVYLGHIVQFLMNISRAGYERAHFGIVLDASTGPTQLGTVPEHARNQRWTSISRLRSAGRIEAAEQLTELIAIIGEDPDEPELDVESLMYFADFLIDEPRFGTPVIGTDPDGRLQAEWHVLSQGLLVMNFRQDGRIRFVAASEPARLGKERMRVSGTLRKRDALRAIEPFLK